MFRETIVILGIPIDNFNMDETVERIFDMIKAFRGDGRPRQVATVNVDFVVNTLTWRLSRFRHPELVDILRKADLVTPDGMPIIWASRMLGTPLKERVTGADLVLRLVEAAARYGKSIYFLGGSGDVGQRAAQKMQARFPEFKVAGVDSPIVRIEGELLSEEETKDFRVIDRINNSGADILLIGFGNPKQEVWFERNRGRLNIPVSIGIGGSYEFIAGSVARAPEWMQNAGLEWVFRIVQEPKRLWKRYFVGFFKFGLMIFPAIIYYKFKRHTAKIIESGEHRFNIRGHEDSLPDNTIFRVVPMPEVIDVKAVENMRMGMDNDLVASSNLILDFKNVRFIDSSGLGLMISLWRHAKSSNKILYLIDIKPPARRFFKLSRTLDIFKGRIFDTLEDAVNHITVSEKQPPFYYLAVTRKHDVTLKLHGTLDASQMQNMNIDVILNIIGKSNCLLDLSKLDFVDSSGVVFFLKIQKYVKKNDRVCILFGLQDNVMQMFRITKMDRLFRIAPNQIQAEHQLTKKP
jgi:exopolysaccharide biosynthesis WecB/TagA/CpsF family protein/anti-anti-sigma factor